MNKISSEKLCNVSLILVLVLGVVLRIAFFLKNPSLWVDEASLAANILNKSYRELFKGLEYMQAAPIGFTALVKAVVEFINPQSIYSRDLVLRFVPFMSSLLAIPVFYHLAKNVFQNNKQSLLISVTMFVLNPALILYSAQLKQYSTEVLCAVLLLLLFIRIIKSNSLKWWYLLIISIIPWFSYSSFFIVGSGLLAILFKNKKNFVPCFVATLLSCIIYYFLSLKSVSMTNYAGMDLYWKNCNAFWEFQHPTRLFFKLGNLYTLSKPLSFCAGTIILWAYVKYVFSETKISEKLLFLTPLILLVIASFLHKYPLSARLILFLVPIFAVLTANLKKYFGLILNLLLLCIIFVSFSTYAPDSGSISRSYARKMLLELQDEISPEDNIIIETPVCYGNKLMFTEYDYYLAFLDFKNKIIKIPLMCRGYTLPVCKQTLESLPAGNYYLFSTAKLDKSLLDFEGVEFKDFEKSKALYFVKR